MYGIVVFLHVLSVFGFLLSHGTSTIALFQMKRERRPDGLAWLIELSRGTVMALSVALLGVLVTGIIAGFMGHFWGRGWIWAAIALFVAISFAMSAWGRLYFDKVLVALGLPTMDMSKKGQAAPAPVGPSELDALLKQAQPERLGVIGFGGLVIILWLMMYKPF